MADAAFSNAAAGDAGRIGDTVAELLADRRALIALVDRLGSALWRGRQRLAPVVGAVITALRADHLTVALQVRLAVQGLPWDDMATLLEGLAGDQALQADALMEACDALSGAAARPDGAEIEALERRLAGSADPVLRRLGLAALVGWAWHTDGWNAQTMARLRVYRADAARLVAAAAQFTLPPNEDELA